jgi:AcrR family transcriptional regulator
VTGQVTGVSGRRWTQNPDAVQDNILTEAMAEFAAKGLSGARVDDIAARTRTSKRMIYYYFGDKAGLYRAVLDRAYAGMSAAEQGLNLGGLPPADALRALVAFTFHHHAAAPDFVRLVAVENIHGAAHLDADALPGRNAAVLVLLGDILRRGAEAGVFRRSLDALAVHWQISALCFYNVSNRPTFSCLFGGGLFTDDGQARLCDQVCDMVLRFVAADQPPS